MLQLRTDYANESPETPQNTLSSYTAHLKDVYTDGGYTAAESSLNLPADQALLESVKAIIAEKVTDSLKYSIVVGIGGSNLGTKAVYDALYANRDLLSSAHLPRALFAETTDPDWLLQASTLLESLPSKEEVLVTLISKSGGTTETIANFEILMAALNTRFGDAADRVVVITDEDSNLWKAAATKGMPCLAIPNLVGGRYSVLSAVGLFPLLSVGIDIVQLRKGAEDMLKRCLESTNEVDNIAMQSAGILASQLANGKTINDNFFFNPELESVGKWYRQLMGESIGKEKSLDGTTVHAGITPTVSLGSTDLHSVGQLYLGGPKDKLTTFVSTATATAHSEVPAARIFPELVPMIAHKSAGDIMTAILEGVKVAYQNAGLPYMEVVLDAIDEYSIGAFLQFKMLEMMYLGQLLNVNSFDQPNVESYKIETKRILQS